MYRDATQQKWFHHRMRFKNTQRMLSFVVYFLVSLLVHRASATDAVYDYCMTDYICPEGLCRYVNPTPVTNENFGTGVSMYNHLAVVGTSGSSVNKFYVFEQQEYALDAWQLVFSYDFVGSGDTPSATTSDGFGSAIDIYDTTIVVGAPDFDHTTFNSGAAFVFIMSSSSVWTLNNLLYPATNLPVASSHKCGNNVAIQGSTIIVGCKDGWINGAPQMGYAIVFRETSLGTNDWTEMELLRPETSPGIVDPLAAAQDYFGFSIALDESQAIAAVGAYSYNGCLSNAGGVFIFNKPTSMLEAYETICIDDPQLNAQLGWAVAIVGEYVAIGEPSGYPDGYNVGAKTGRVHVCKDAGSGYSCFIIVPSDGISNDNFGKSVGLVDGRLLVGSPNSRSYLGRTYLFYEDRAGTNTWSRRIRYASEQTPNGEAIANEFLGTAMKLTSTGAIVSAGSKDGFYMLHRSCDMPTWSYNGDVVDGCPANEVIVNSTFGKITGLLTTPTEEFDVFCHVDGIGWNKGAEICRDKTCDLSLYEFPVNVESPVTCYIDTVYGNITDKALQWEACKFTVSVINTPQEPVEAVCVAHWNKTEPMGLYDISHLNDQFLDFTDVAADGPLFVVPRTQSDLATSQICIYEQDDIHRDQFAQVQCIDGTDDSAVASYYGWAVDISGTTIVVGAPYYDYSRGYVRIYDEDSPGSRNWVQTIELQAVGHRTANGGFGSNVHIVGDRLFVATPRVATQIDSYFNNAGQVDYYHRDEFGVWQLVHPMYCDVSATGTFFGDYKAMAISGYTAAIGAAQMRGSDMVGRAGKVHIFVLDPEADTWAATQVLEVANDGTCSNGCLFGYSLRMEDELLVIGSRGGPTGWYVGAAYIFEEVTPGWFELVQELVPESEEFGVNSEYGYEIAMNERSIAVSAPQVGAGDVGKVFFFEETSPGSKLWVEAQSLLGDYYGVGGSGASLTQMFARMDMSDDYLIATGGQSAAHSAGMYFIPRDCVKPTIDNCPVYDETQVMSEIPVSSGVSLTSAGGEVICSPPLDEALPVNEATLIGCYVVDDASNVGTCAFEVLVAGACFDVTCNNGGTCSVVDNVGVCECTVEYTDSACDTYIDPCIPDSPCSVGVCTDEGNGAYSCDCTDTGYEGINCDIDIDECATTPCVYGTCSTFELLNDFSCLCDDGYEGLLCDVDINECDSNPCQNSGVCTDVVNGFMCTCLDKSGYKGIYCTDDVDDCASSPCENAGICTDDGINAFTCDCSDTAYEGLTCEIFISITSSSSDNSMTSTYTGSSHTSSDDTSSPSSSSADSSTSSHMGQNTAATTAMNTSSSTGDMSWTSSDLNKTDTYQAVVIKVEYGNVANEAEFNDYIDRLPSILAAHVEGASAGDFEIIQTGTELEIIFITSVDENADVMGATIKTVLEDDEEGQQVAGTIKVTYVVEGESNTDDDVNTKNNDSTLIMVIVIVGCVVVLMGGIVAYTFLRRQRTKLTNGTASYSMPT